MPFGANIVKPMGALFTGTPALTASARPYPIAVDWNLPLALQSMLGGGVAGGLNLDLENCLLENSWVNFWGLRNTPSCLLKMQNCTQRGGGDWLRNANPYASWSVTVHDSAFDGTQIVTPYGNFSSEDCSYNAYLSEASRWPNDANDTTVSGGFDWQTGPLGDAYLPNDPPAQDGTLLIGAGDSPASSVAGWTGTSLATFTTQIDGMPNGNGIVDIGYHYPILRLNGPTLTTACRPTSIVLNWTLDAAAQEIESLGFASAICVEDFKIYRANSPGGPYTLVATVLDPVRSFEDDSSTDPLGFDPNQSYCYLVAMEYYNSLVGVNYPMDPLVADSNGSCASTCSVPPPPPGDIDVAFIIDNTDSMAQGDPNGLTAVQSAIHNVLNDLVAAAGDKGYRLALVTPDTDGEVNPVTGANDQSGHDMVVVQLNFSPNNRDAFETALNAVVTATHNSNPQWPESTDECLNTVVNQLSSTGRQNINQDLNNCNCSNGNEPPKPLLQLGDFANAFNMNARKLVVLITDAVPGGFCDPSYNPYAPETYSANLGTYAAQAHQYAVQAASKGIQINAIQLGNFFGVWDAAAGPVMRDYANTTCGWYSTFNYTDSTGIESALRNMLYNTTGDCH